MALHNLSLLLQRQLAAAIGAGPRFSFALGLQPITEALPVKGVAAAGIHVAALRAL